MNSNGDLYELLLAEAECLTGQTVMRPYVNDETIAYCRSCPPDIDHWQIEIPAGIMGWRRLDDGDGDVVPVRVRYCAQDAATAWLAGFVYCWHAEHGINEALTARALKLNADKRPHISGGFDSGVYAYGRWNWSPPKYQWL